MQDDRSQKQESTSEEEINTSDAIAEASEEKPNITSSNDMPEEHTEGHIEGQSDEQTIETANTSHVAHNLTEDMPTESKPPVSPRATGKRLSLEDLDTEELLQPKTEEASSPSEDSIKKTAWDQKIESILTLVEDFLQKNDQQSIASILRKLTTNLEDNNLIFGATASAQKDFIETHMASINKFIQDSLSNAPILSVMYEQQEKQEKKGVLQNAKKTAESMHEKNPALRNFIDDLGLEIDYSA